VPVVLERVGSIFKYRGITIGYVLLLAVITVTGGIYFMTGRALRLPPRFEQPQGEMSSPAGAFYIKVPVADVRAAADQGAELVTQALLGDGVRVIKQEGEWLYGQVPDGYVGWLKKAEVVEDVPPRVQDLVAVISPRAELHQGPGTGTAVAGEALMGTDLPLLKEEEAWVEVWLPGQGTAWLARQEIEVWPRGRPPGDRSGQDVIRVAERLQGVPYLWGGVSLYGIDCSGLTYIAYYLNGVQLPRDADMQFDEGKKVDRVDLQAGDLVFFNTKGTGILPTHVGIYKGNGQFLNSRSRQGVIISSLDEPVFASGYLGACRYLQPAR